MFTGLIHPNLSVATEVHYLNATFQGPERQKHREAKGVGPVSNPLPWPLAFQASLSPSDLQQRSGEQPFPVSKLFAPPHEAHAQSYVHHINDAFAANGQGHAPVLSEIVQVGQCAHVCPHANAATKQQIAERNGVPPRLQICPWQHLSFGSSPCA